MLPFLSKMNNVSHENEIINDLFADVGSLRSCTINTSRSNFFFILLCKLPNTCLCFWQFPQQMFRCGPQIKIAAKPKLQSVKSVISRRGTNEDLRILIKCGKQRPSWFRTFELSRLFGHVLSALMPNGEKNSGKSFCPLDPGVWNFWVAF